ncbi:MAG: hypothetical protein Tsb0021_08740 [Chlamydiales bacterium]
MSWNKWTIMTLFALITAPLAAQYNENCMVSCEECDSYECCDECLNWTVYGDWLYWRARRCQLDYALPFDGSNAIGRVSEVCPKYDNGFRIGVETKLCDAYFGIEYTRYKTDATSTLSNPNGGIAGTQLIDAYTQLSQGSIQLARGDWDLCLDQVDLRMGYQIASECDYEAKVFGGFKFAYIDQDFNSFYSANINPQSEGNNLEYIKQQVKMDGYGLELGMCGSYNLCRCLNFIGLFSYDILAADFDRHYIYETMNVDEGAVLRANLRDSCWKLVSVINLAVGLRYDYQNLFCRDVDLSLSLGYEFHHWINYLGFMEHQNESGEVTVDRYSDNLGLDGLFLRASLSF